MSMLLEFDIHNYYEHLVIEYISTQQLDLIYDQEFLGDLCCLSLSNLPARYVRHDIDMAFFLSSDQRQEMEDEVSQTVDNAVKFLNQKT